MFTELGHFALILAFVMSAFIAVLPFFGLRRDASALVALAAPATLVMAAAVCLSFAALC